MKYGQFYYSYGVYGTEGSPNMYLASNSVSATTALLRKLKLIALESVTQSLMTANLINIWDNTPANPATWQDATLIPSVWTDQTVSDADWQDTRT